MRRIFAFVGVALMAIAAEAQMFGGWQMPQAKMEYSQKFADVNYAGDGQVYHNMDIYLPKVERQSYPVVIHIYGSAWYSNNSKGAADLGTICQALLDAGYAVVTPNHRSSGDAKFPAQINDIKAVVRFVRAHAAEYKLDPSFVATSGFSSGGHLASLTATSGYVAELEGEVGGNLEYSSSVDAACDWSGPVDMFHMDCNGDRGPGAAAPEEAVMGFKMEGNEGRFAALNATTYIDPTDPPVVIFHGDADNVVPGCQGPWFYDCLTKAGVKSELHVVKGGGHGVNMYAKENLDSMVLFLNNARAEKRAKRFPTINADNSVSFRVRSQEAGRIQVDLGKRYDMKKVGDGNWVCKTEPQSEGFHYYSLYIDGVQVADPSAESYYGCSMMSSGIEIPYPEGDNRFYLQDVPHGTIAHKWYFSTTTNEWREMYVYLPPQYFSNKKSYPVLYIMHGGGEDERGWAQQGRTDIILDNLLAEDMAEPMIVAMLDGNTSDFESELIDNCIPYVEETFRVKKGADYRALAGLSMGGIQTLNTIVNHKDLFRYVGVFSSGWFASRAPMGGSGDDTEKMYQMLQADKDGYNAQFKQLYLTMGGESDIAYNNCKVMRARFDEIGINYTYFETPGGHTWPVWRVSLYNFAQMLFKK